MHERGDEYRSQWETICAIAEQLGPSAETIRGWVRRDELRRRGADGDQPPASGDARRRIEELEREVRELRRSNEILKAAFAIVARDLDVEVSD